MKVSELVLTMTHFTGTVSVMRVKLQDVMHVVITAEQMHLPK